MCDNILSLGMLIALYSICDGDVNTCSLLSSSIDTSGCNANNTARCKEGDRGEEIRCDQLVHMGCVDAYKIEMKSINMACHGTKNASADSCGLGKCSLERYNQRYVCCCHQTICRFNVTFPITRPTTTPARTTSAPPSNDLMLVVYIVVPIFVLLFFFALLTLVRKHKDVVCQENGHLLEPLSPKIQSSQVHLLETIYKGQFADVLKAQYAQEIVAVKNVQPSQINLWSNEKDIYEKFSLRHDNILRFISADTLTRDDVVQYWIITEYCVHGSLRDYLYKYTLSVADLFRMILCILKGLDYMHSSTLSSAAIAHRDLKSSNILVKSDHSCCIADFGLSMAFPTEDVYVSGTDVLQVGTIRYMAPEVLRGAMTFSPECFIAVDMYSFALVSWELISRTYTSQITPDTYELPFAGGGGDSLPTIQSMIKCVVEEDTRPVLKEIWRTDSTLSHLCETITECWDSDAHARVGARLAYHRLSGLSVGASCTEVVRDCREEGEVIFTEPAVDQALMLDVEV